MMKAIVFFTEAFNRYRELEINTEIGLNKGVGLDLEVTQNQVAFKENYQCLVEEMAELTEYFHSTSREFKQKNRQGIMDELCDITNFFHSLMIKAKLRPQDMIMPERLYTHSRNDITFNSFNEIGTEFYKVIHYTGLACNVLKNRPWKKENYRVDFANLHNNLKWAYYHLVYTYALCGIDFDELNKAHLEKIAKVSHRFKSGY